MTYLICIITRGLCSYNARLFNDDVTAIGVSYWRRREFPNYARLHRRRMPTKVRLYERFDGTHHFGVVFSGAYPQFSVDSSDLLTHCPLRDVVVILKCDFHITGIVKESNESYFCSWWDIRWSMLSVLLLVSIMVRHCIRTIFRFRLELLKLSVLPRDETSSRFG